MILPLEQQVASRELSEKLKNLGFPQDTYFWWRYNYEKEEWEISHDPCILNINLSNWAKKIGIWNSDDSMESNWDKINSNLKPVIAAPTSAEIAIVNPESQYVFYSTDDTEANKRAKHTIYLAEQGLVKFEKGGV